AAGPALVPAGGARVGLAPGPGAATARAPLPGDELAVHPVRGRAGAAGRSRGRPAARGTRRRAGPARDPGREDTRMTRRLLVVVGTRPEAIKLAPLVLEARRAPELFETVVVSTGQHREMLA